jgi:hypothetical protein
MTVVLVLALFAAFWIVELFRRRLVVLPLQEVVESQGGQAVGGNAVPERRKGERRSGTMGDRRKAA